jgi:tRNA threonylcarbamoyl adenosine modification protein (Sua5/YciO/YrdC/YwlC family)
VISTVDGAAFERCMSVGGVAVFPSDTVYGLACDAHSRVAVQRLYSLKRRPPDKPSAVMFFDLRLALDALPELGPRTRAALARLLPGAVTVLLPNPELRFALACGADPLTLGLRVPVVPGLAGVRWPVVQSSANLAGGPEARELEEVPTALQQAADMVIDGGRLPGTASTVVDLRAYEDENEWRILRPGAVSADSVAAALAGQFHFDPSGYGEMIRADIPLYERLQAEVATASGVGARRVLELGTGTGETAAALLDRHPGAELVGIDESSAMLGVARSRLPTDRVSLHVGRLDEPLPEGPFDLVASALCVHHVSGAEKRDLFARVAGVLGPGGRFVLGDVIVPEDSADAVTSLTPDFDRPSSLADQLQWLDEAGFDARLVWRHRDLVVVSAELARD